jgi:transcriptional regulator with XRE-family HTH domain
MKISFKDAFPARIAELRKEKAAKQSDISAEVGCSNHSVSKMELGQRLPSVEILLAMADYFDVSVDYLLGRTDKREMNR